jgi:ATP/maltotriose-dependent transcriptional regulator MalT
MFNPSNPISVNLQLQTNLKPDNLSKENNQPTLFSEYLLDTVQSVAKDGMNVESLSSGSNDATELAMAMDQFLVELNALKALVDETRKAIDRIFNEARA